MKPICMITFVILLFSCTEASNIKRFPVERALTSQSVPVDTVLLRFPYRIAVKAGVAVVMDLHPVEDYLHAFALPEMRHIVSFGHRGQGSDEMLSAENFRFVSLDSIWTLDANRMNIVRWSLSPVSAIVERVEEIALDKSLIRTLDFCLTDNGFIVPDYSGVNRYHLTGKAGKIIESAGAIPTRANKKALPLALSQAWRGFLAFNPQQNTLAIATQLGEVLEIYRLDTTTYAVIYGASGEPRFHVSGGEGIPQGIMGYFDVQMTEQFIYALFSGQTLKEISQNAMKGLRNERGGRYIHVFDLEGNPVCKYTLDRAVCGIDVHESEQIIYAVDANSDDPVVVFRIDMLWEEVPLCHF